MAALGDEASTLPRRRRTRLIVVFTLLLAGGLVAGAVYLLIRPARPLPRTFEIGSMAARVQIDPESPQLVTFQVPQAHWDAILSAMLPARRDDQPLKWIGFGHLDLGLKSGAALRIDFYDPGERQGAFAAGPTFESRVYYRGGNTAELREALGKAFKDSSEPAAKRVDTDERVIRRGMRLDDALARIRKQGLQAQQDDLELAPADAAPAPAEAHTYRISGGKSVDALFLYASRKADEKDLVVESLWWWKDWDADSKRPKGERKAKWTFVDSVSLADVE